MEDTYNKFPNSKGNKDSNIGAIEEMMTCPFIIQKKEPENIILFDEMEKKRNDETEKKFKRLGYFNYIKELY